MQTPHTPLSLCQAALATLHSTGFRAVIGSMEDRCDAGEACRAVYAGTRDALLSCHAWRFATRTSFSMRSKVMSDTHSAAFVLPDDLLRVLSAHCPLMRPFAYRLSEGLIHADVHSVILTYIRRVPEDEFPAFFAKALVARLAAEIANALPAFFTKTFTDILLRKAQDELVWARAADSSDMRSLAPKAAPENQGATPQENIEAGTTSPSMRFDLGAAPAIPTVQVGDVYPAKGGVGGNTRYWLVVAISPQGSTYLLGLDEAGVVVSTGSYAAQDLRHRPRIGSCLEISSWVPKIVWEKA